MKNIKIYKKGLLIGFGATFLFPNLTGCSSSQEVLDVKEEVVSENPDWLEERMHEKETVKVTEEEIEKAAVEAFESWASDIENCFKEVNDSAAMQGAKDKVATTFIYMTDVLFYGKEIEYGDGKTTSVPELSDKAVEKLELIYSTVDSKIESYWPSYKEEIEEKWRLGKGYISDKAGVLKLYLLDKASNHMTEEDYNKAGEYWRLFKKQSQSDLEEGKEVLKNLWNQGTDFADKKYKEFKKETEEGYSK